MTVRSVPHALFDTLQQLERQLPAADWSSVQRDDFLVSWRFLRSYVGSLGTFNSYRREVERLLQWCGLIAGKSLRELKRDDIETFVKFCQHPPVTWIGTKKVARFIEQDGQRIPNPVWRPYVVTLSKAATRAGKSLAIEQFKLSSGALKQLFAILSTFYSYLLQEEYVAANPVMLVRQKSKYIQRHQGPARIRRLSELQWRYVLQTAQAMAEENPRVHERTLFVMSILYAMYLRISELAAAPRWVPQMNHFQRDSEGDWWFTTVGKGNKLRQIAVSDAMLQSLKRWRQFLGLTPLPSPADNSPLLPKIIGQGAISNTNQIRKIVQYCFDRTMLALQQDHFTEEAAALVEATVHWLRHTGISDDVKRRPREHVRDDAGHSSGATTDKYIDIERRERHRSAKNKPLVEE